MNELFEMSWGERTHLLALAAAHLNQVVEALALALALGLLLGMLATRSARLERIVLGVASVMNSLPALALLGLVLYVCGGQQGGPTVILALFLYALPPIARGTVLGLKGIDPALVEASEGIGMTPKQRMLWVEMPLAAPKVLAGVRQAAVGSVGLAAIGTLLGAQNLGAAILQGIQRSNPGLLLASSGLTALLALTFAGALGTLERAFDPGSARRSPLFAWLAQGALAALVAVGVYGGLADTLSRATGSTIAIGSKGSRESIMLGHMLADLVEAHTDLSVDRRFSLGDSTVCYGALKKGEIDAYADYTGTALAKLFKQPEQPEKEKGAEPSAEDARPEKIAAALKAYRLQVLERLRKNCREDGIACLEPLGFENRTCLLMRRDFAKRMGIARISDLRKHEGRLRTGFSAEFISSPDGYEGFVKAYALDFQVRRRELETNVLYDNLSWRLIDLIAGESTDGRNDTLGLIELEDDLHFFPVNEAVPLVRESTLKKYPKLRGALERLAGKLDDTEIQKLNHQSIDLEREPAEVAHEFLQKTGLLKK